MMQLYLLPLYQNEAKYECCRLARVMLFRARVCAGVIRVGAALLTSRPHSQLTQSQARLSCQSGRETPFLYLQLTN